MSKRFLITSALPYINGIKHLGNLIGSMLPADVYARFRRQEGHEVLFICATDEHGTPAELAAAAAGATPAAYCAQMHVRQAEMYRRFALSFDHFGRTSHPHNHTLTQGLYRDLKEQGLTETRQITQLYSPQDGRFLPDRYVVGTCPRCSYLQARGDQCEACAALLDPSDLKDARSALSGSANLEPRPSAHIFLRLSAAQDQVAVWVGQQGKNWGEMTLSIAHKWLNEGLRDRCISRDLAWGVHLPEADPQLAGKVFYVWFDAPIGYISATCEWAEARGQPDAWRRWWVSDEAGDTSGGGADADGNENLVEYSQFMAKDNVPFHTIMFPAMVMGGKTGYRLPDRIKGFNWLNYYGEKFSTSQGRGVFLDEALDIYDADIWRYSLLVQAPEGRDGAFTWEEFALRVNKDLNDTLGNFVHRVLRFVESRMGPTVPAGGEAGEAEWELARRLGERARAIAGHLAAQDFRKATEQLRDTWGEGNLYIDRTAPWKLWKTAPGQAAMHLRTCINVMVAYTGLMAPFMPACAERLRHALGLLPGSGPGPEIWRGEVNMNALAPGHPLTVPPPLFAKIDAAAVAALRARFGGAPATAVAAATRQADGGPT